MCRALTTCLCLCVLLMPGCAFGALPVPDRAAQPQDRPGILLQQEAWRQFLSIPKEQNLPAPLLATLVLTTLLPSVPILKGVDTWLLCRFHEWGAIPAEVKRRAAAMTPHSFIVTPGDVAALREAYDGAEGDTFCANERDVAHTHEAEEAGEIAFLMVERSHGRRRNVEAAARRADDDSLGTAETLAARCCVAECLCRHGKAVDPSLQLAWDAEVVHRGAEHNDVGRDELIEHRADGREAGARRHHSRARPGAAAGHSR